MVIVQGLGEALAKLTHLVVVDVDQRRNAWPAGAPLFLGP